MQKTIDIRDNQEIIDTINAILSNKGIAEVKVERGQDVLVVETHRTVKARSGVKDD